MARNQKSGEAPKLQDAREQNARNDKKDKKDKKEKKHKKDSSLKARKSPEPPDTPLTVTESSLRPNEVSAAETKPDAQDVDGLGPGRGTGQKLTFGFAKDRGKAQAHSGARQASPDRVMQRATNVPPVPSRPVRLEKTFDRAELKELSVSEAGPRDLSWILNPKRVLGLAEKLVLQVLMDPDPLDDLAPGGSLLAALGLAALGATPGRVALGLLPTALKRHERRPVTAPLPLGQPPPPISAAPTMASQFTGPPRSAIPPHEWPSPSPDSVQRMLAHFPQLDGHCRGSLLRLASQHALAILWDMDAKGGADEIKDPQAFIFSASQALQQMQIGAMAGLLLRHTEPSHGAFSAPHIVVPPVPFAGLR